MTPIRPAALLTAFVAILGAQGAVAQQATPAPAAVEVPASTCKDPGFAPLDRNSPDMGRFQKRFDDYKACIQAYVATLQAKVTEYQNQASAYSDVANKSIDEYNTYVNKLNESGKTNKPGAEKK